MRRSQNLNYAAFLSLGIEISFSGSACFGRRAMSGKTSEHTITIAMTRIAG